MPSTPRLESLLRRAVGLESQEREHAFEELVRLLIIMVRSRMDPRLRARRESMDVCQSVAKSFIEDLQAGRIAFENEASLAAYLQKVVRNKMTDLARHDNAARRGGGGTPLAIDDERGVGEQFISAGGESPDEEIRASELREKALHDLTDADRILMDLRRRGLDWQQVADQLGESSESVRKRWSRLRERLVDRLRDKE